MGRRLGAFALFGLLLFGCGGEASSGEGSAEAPTSESSASEQDNAGTDHVMSDVVIGTTDETFGFLICSPRPLHGCVGRTEIRHGVRLFPTVDIAATADCAGQRQAAEDRCPALDSEPRRQLCMARYGVLLDSIASYEEGREPGPRAQFTVVCREGSARIDIIEPI